MDKIVCVGKNYSDHAKEMGGTGAEKPVVFLKPPSVLRQGRAGEMLSLKLPQGQGAIHYECEIVLRIGSEGAIDAVSLGLDLTKRDLQAQQKAKGQPWTTSKVFVDSAIVGPRLAVTQFTEWQKEPFQFYLDGNLKQEGVSSQMTLSPSQCVAYINQLFPLCPGDIIFTGTPKGVGEIKPGQQGRLVWGKMQYSVKWTADEVAKKH